MLFSIMGSVIVLLRRIKIRPNQVKSEGHQHTACLNILSYFIARFSKAIRTFVLLLYLMIYSFLSFQNGGVYSSLQPVLEGRVRAMSYSPTGARMPDRQISYI